MIDELRAWLSSKARDEYYSDPTGHKADTDPFAWLAAKLSEDLVAKAAEERIVDAVRRNRDRIASWLKNAAPCMTSVTKCKTHRDVCDKLADYVAREVY